MKIWHEVWDYIKMIIIVVAIVLVINNVVLINAKIPSPSMEKTIMTGDRIFGFRLAYGINLDLFGHEISKKVKDPERFDIVIFKYPDDESQLFIKRVIGLPGETVQIRDSRVYIDGEPLKEDKMGEVSLAGRAADPVRLGEKEGDEPQFDPGVMTEGENTYLYTGFCAIGDKSRSGPMGTVLGPDMLTIKRGFLVNAVVAVCSFMRLLCADKVYIIRLGVEYIQRMW